MHDGELWQVFSQNGQAINGRGATDEEFTHNDELVMGNAHVWLWRRTPRGIEVLLQKRSKTRSRSPGMFHISAAGHINAGESPVKAAERETREELGYTIDPNKLHLVHVTRTARHLNSLLYVFTYEYTEGDFTFDDGEVELIQWRPIETFELMAERANDYQLIDQGQGYFAPLIESIKRQAA
ncbi:MAG TPA: NUDIX domain-containing protein [Candidatus Saccharimonadales bacterium]